MTGWARSTREPLRAPDRTVRRIMAGSLTHVAPGAASRARRSRRFTSGRELAAEQRVDADDHETDREEGREPDPGRHARSGDACAGELFFVRVRAADRSGRRRRDAGGALVALF